ncbi:MAG TPA: hypothetical protein VF190_09620 [Rhodothermales bacterium]
MQFLRPPSLLERPVRAACIALLLAVGTAGIVRAQVSPAYYDYARPQLDWYTIETDHFNVIFHGDVDGAGSSRTAQVVARIAEEVYGPITDLYALEPDERVSIILKDYEDYSNGAAYFFDNKIEIWVPALDSPLRGDHNWLRNVITHEFTHIVQVQTTMKASRKLPFFYVQWMEYEDVRRPDVLYGYPNVIASYPIPTISNPAWFAEGTAQYMRAGLRYDEWDSHRDMLLRTRILAGEELSLAEMGGFYSHTSLERETVYNHGFAFTRYLANVYGEDAIARVSRSLGEWDNWNIERAMDDALGIRGERVYEAWIDTLRIAYEASTSAIRANEVAGETVEPDGSHNFYPRYAPDGSRLAYLSNRGRDFATTGLFVRDLHSGAVSVLDTEGLVSEQPIYTCALGHRVVSAVGGSFSWTPDGNAIVYPRNVDTWEGHAYSDLYRVDVASRKRERLTRGLRASQPEVSPDGRTVAFVAQKDGTSNLFLLDLETKDVRQLTDYSAGVQVTDPRWHPNGRWVYIARFAGESRDLYRIDATASTPGQGVPVLATDADERSPAPDARGEYLYFSSDATGIFNIYRLALTADGIPAGDSEVVTNVVGGAFMPSPHPTADAIAFSRYDWNGYKIAVLETPASGSTPALAMYEAPAVLRKPGEGVPGDYAWERLNAFDDTDLQPIPPQLLADVGVTGEALRPPAGTGASTTDAVDTDVPERTVDEYHSLFTSFSFFPVYRLDRYTERREDDMEARLPRRTRAESLLRDSKVGVYVSSREVLEGLSLLGGLLLGPSSTDADGIGSFFAPSNLIRMERDAFLQFEYRKGFGLIPKRWSPQVTVEMYNIRRNVAAGLTIEEFPCTACYPDTTTADLAYNLWEASIAVRAKVNRALLLEAGYRFSPYRVTTERFFSREANQSIPSSSSKYYIGRAIGLKAYYELENPHRHDDVVPERLIANLSYEFEPGSLLQRFDVEDGLLVPGYENFHNHRLVLDVREGFRLPGLISGAPHGLDFRLRASTILGGAVDDFFDDYVGGLIGARGYPFYALGGNETLWLQASYNVPLFPDVGHQVLFAYIDKIYARLYADAAAAWSGSFPGVDAFRKDVGAELRVGLGSFYLFPSALFLSATYGLDSFDVELNEGFVTPDGSTSVRYGESLQWHFGLLFDFDL